VTGPLGLRQTTAPTTEPVTLAEAKARLRVSGTDEDGDILALIAEAVRAAEGECGRQFCAAAYTLYLDDFPRGADDAIRLPRPPAQSVTSVQYYAEDGTLTTLDTADYIVAVGSDPGRVVPAVDEYWPAVQTRPEAVRVVYVAGYGAASAVPRQAKAAVLEILAHRWKTRGDESAAGIPPVARRLLDQLEYGEVR
jgi:uncharacterized phiE125 gp8 family phage protein